MKKFDSQKLLQLALSTTTLLVLSANNAIVQAQGQGRNETLPGRLPNHNNSDEIAPIQNFGITPELTDYEGAITGRSFVFYLVFIWRALIFIAGLAVLINLVIGAIDWINAGGDKGKIEKARDKMSQAVIGFVVLVGLLAIAQFLNVIFGINLLQLDVPTVTDERFIP